jgi:predicted nicotinamide N-methyase
LTDEDAAAFIMANTQPGTAKLVPEIVLRLATEITPIWQATEDFLHANNIAPPFWAFAWPGSQVLARMVLDRPELVRGARVLDFAAGCGLAALAAARAGAAHVEAAEIDPLASAATRINAVANGLAVQAETGDVVGAARRWDVILCGDVCYEAPMTRHILPWLRRMAAEGAAVWLADPGRAYVPRESMVEVSRTDVPTSLELEDQVVRTTVVYRLGGVGDGDLHLFSPVQRTANQNRVDKR